MDCAQFFTGWLERILPPEQRFACLQYPNNVVWVAGDATLCHLAGISWRDKEYLVLETPRSIRPFKLDAEEAVIINECELLAAIMCIDMACAQGGDPDYMHC